MRAKRREQPNTNTSPCGTPLEQILEQAMVLRQAADRFERLCWSQFERESQPRLYVVIENGQILPAVNRIELESWYHAPASVLLDLAHYMLWLWPSGTSERRRLALTGPASDDTCKLTGPMLDFLQTLAEHPGLRLTPIVTGELTGRVISSAAAKQCKSRIHARLGPICDQMILTETIISQSLPGRGPVYYANPELTWRVVRYADFLSPKQPPK